MACWVYAICVENNLTTIVEYYYYNGGWYSEDERTLFYQMVVRLQPDIVDDIDDFFQKTGS